MASETDSEDRLVFHAQLVGVVADIRANERQRIRRHLLTVVTDNTRHGNDSLLGALLDAIRELEDA